jgi:arylsulfatase A-like enzyme
MNPYQSPNVIVFFTDQQRWDTTGVHGNPLNLTPNFDRMARSGTHVYNSFTCQPVCGPARSCLQTGLYATQTGVYVNGPSLKPDAKTLAHYFREAGYITGYIGKWHLSKEEPVPESERGGYEYWLAANLLEFESRPYDTVMYDQDNKAVKLPGYRIDALTDAAIRYIDKHQNANQDAPPFFLFLSYLEPHHQNHIDDYPAPVGYQECYQGRWVPSDLAALGGSTHQHIGGYYGLVKRLDEALGRLMDALISLGMDKNTIILFTSDHGNHFKTRNAEYKRSCHEASIRVPTMLIGPGFNGGGQINKLVSLIDLPPTLLDAAGIPLPAHMEGHSILPLTRGEEIYWPDDIFIQISESQVGRAIRTSRWKYSVSAPNKNGWAYEYDSDVYAEEFLYDLEADPHELNNLIGYESHQIVTKVLRERLLRYLRKVEGVEPEIQTAAECGSGQRIVTPEEARL